MNNNLFSFSKLILSLSCILFLAGCARYQASSLNGLLTRPDAADQEQTISFAYHIFTKNDCKKYLDRDVIAKGYQPVQITISNNSARQVYISTKNFSFPCVDAQEVAPYVHTSTVKRAVCYGVVGLFIWPFLVPAIVDGIGSHEANQQLNSDFERKTIHDQVIRPYSTLNGIIFVPIECFSPNFTCAVVDQKNNERFIFSSTTTQLKA